MSELARVPADRIQEGKAVRVEGGPDGICLVLLPDGYHAVADRCSHADVALSEGEVDPDECTVECWKHGSTFSITRRPSPVASRHKAGPGLCRCAETGDELVVSEQ